MFHARKDYNERVQDSKNIIPENEPVFLLRGQDPMAEETLNFYAASIEDNGADPAIVASVREQAIRMGEWSEKKIPDAPDKVVYLEGNPKHPSNIITINLKGKENDNYEKDDTYYKYELTDEEKIAARERKAKADEKERSKLKNIEAPIAAEKDGSDEDGKNKIKRKFS